MRTRKLNVLFLCTGNSARSIIAEALLNASSDGKLRAYSAGSRPAGAVQPLALEVLRQNGLPTEGLRSKDASELDRPGAPRMDIVVTLCDEAAASCPRWPGEPIRAHWSIDDPVAIAGSEAEQRSAFARVFSDLQDRLLIFASLPLDKLERGILERRLNEIGRLEAGKEGPTELADRIQSASRPLRRSLKRGGREGARDLGSG